MKEFLNQLFKIIIYGGILQGPFVVLMLNSGEVRKTRANFFLSILLIALSFSIFHIQYAGSVLNHFSVNWHSSGDPTLLLISPLLLLYISELTGNKTKFTLRLVLHFAPFLSLLLSPIFFQFIPAAHALRFPHNFDKLTAILFWIGVVIQFSWYQILIRKKWAAYQKWIEQEVSNTENVNVAWVKFFMGIFLLINFFFLFSLFAAIHLEDIIWPPKIIAAVFSLAIFALGYKGILQKEIFWASTPDSSQVPVASHESVVIKKSDQELINKLLAFMDEKKPFLDPDLTLTGLAKTVGMSRSQLSQVINEGIGDNFYNFINKYRVEQVKQFMSDPKVKHYNMLGLAVEAGFKSKSTFNLIFKRFTGLTPTEYRKNSTQ